MLHQLLVNVIAKKEKKFGKSWARPGFEPGTTDPKSAMLTPRPRILENCLEKHKIYRPGFLKSRFYTFFDNELLSKLHQQFKKYLKLILITFSAKKNPSYRNGNQKRNGVCGHHTPLC